MLRPPLSQERLDRHQDGRLELALKNIWKDGTRALLLEPHDLLVRLCASIPPPWFNMTRYYGVLSSHSAVRSEVVPHQPLDECAHRPAPAAGDQLQLLGELDAHRGTPSRHRWAWLLGRVFQADLERCPKCQGVMRWTQVARTEDTAARLMAKHGMVPTATLSTARAIVATEQLRLPYDT
jgi:hypothetical protein